MNDVRRVAARTTRALGAAMIVPVTVAAIVQPAIALGDEGVPDSVACPGLYVLGVQGTGQSSADSPTAVDSGLLAEVLGPLSAIGDGHVAGRAYVPYSASFGGAMPGTSDTYSQSASEGLERLRDMAADVAARCPRSQLGLIGYSQGAHVVSMFAREVGQGSGVVPADRIAAVALLADPTRAPGAAIFPGLPGRDRPDPAPGTTGAELDVVPEFSRPAASGGGIGPLRDIAADFGALTGRVASLCLPGDLACDAPADTPLLHMIVNIIGRAELVPSDPLAALASISDALSETVARAAVTVVNHDLRGYSLGTLSLTPEKPLSVRLAEAADPRDSAEPDVRAALLKLGTSALNTALAIIGVALTPGEVADLAAAPDPLSGLERAVTAIVTAARRPLPRRTVFNLVTKTFDALGYLSAESAELLDPALWLRYSDTVHRHGDYPNAEYTADGRSATGLVLTWFTAVAEDLARNRIPPPLPPQPDPTPVPTAVPEAEPAPSAAAVPPPPVPEAPTRAETVSGNHAHAVADTGSSRHLSGIGAYLVGLLLLLCFTVCACSAACFARHIQRTRLLGDDTDPDDSADTRPLTVVEPATVAAESETNGNS